MNDFDPTDYDAHLREAQETVIREQAEARANAFLARRPARFAAEGDLDPKILDWCRRVFRRTESGSLVLLGGVGSGKTWSVWKAGETLARNGWRGRFVVVDAYDMKEAMRGRDRDQVSAWREADVLAIDDIGAVGTDDWDADNMHALIDARWKHERPTVLTTNAADLKPIIGPRAASRLQHGATFVRLSHTDRRRAQ